ncbi:MAG: hypothetical protein M0R46_12795 [Candidatus Muirbacterium halophilum]|nr:hypothetical protein [Candidatus Muirbacterium halophilum]
MIKWIKKILGRKELPNKRICDEDYNKLRFENEKKLNIILDKMLKNKKLSINEVDFLRKYNK